MKGKGFKVDAVTTEFITPFLSANKGDNASQEMFLS